MSKDVAVIDPSGKVINIKVNHDDYALQPNEIVVTGAAWIGGDYVAGYFYPPQPYPSWTRHNGEWVSPVPYPSDGGLYSWDEAAGEWVAAE